MLSHRVMHAAIDKARVPSLLEIGRRTTVMKLRQWVRRRRLAVMLRVIVVLRRPSLMLLSCLIRVSRLKLRAEVLEVLRLMPKRVHRRRLVLLLLVLRTGGGRRQESAA